MFKKILCMAMAFAISLSVFAEDLKTVMSYYQPEMGKGFIFISKVDMTLTLVNSQGHVVVSYPIACGQNIGQKSVRGDHKTPEGYFLLQMIQESSNWGHDFHDGKGFIRNAYGPYFLRLQTGFQGIGIHGTHAPESIGTRATEGCIRLNNKHIADLETRVQIGMPVIIGPERGVQQLIASNTPRPAHPRLWVGKAGRQSGDSGLTLAQNNTAAAPATTVPRGKKEPAVSSSVAVTKPERTATPIAAAAPVSAAAVEPSAPVAVPDITPLIVDHPLAIVDGQIDIDPEKDLIDPVLADNAPADPVLADNSSPAPAASSSVADAPVVAASPATTPASTTATQKKGKRRHGPTYIKPEPVDTVPVVKTAPQYEVVVVEVTQPDGTIKYEVQYKPIN